MARRSAALALLASSILGCDSSAQQTPAAPSESAESAAQHEAFAHPPATPGASGSPTQAAPTDAPPPAPRAPFDASNPAVAGLRWTTPASFRFRAPASDMRTAEYVVGRAGETDVVLTVFHFPGMGGSIDANLQRWIGQFTQPDGTSTLAVTRTATSTIGSLRVTSIETGGHFEGGAMGGGTGDGYRLIGAIAEAPGGPVFFKLVGPASVVDAAKPAFDAMVASFARAE